MKRLSSSVKYSTVGCIVIFLFTAVAASDYGQSQLLLEYDFENIDANQGVNIPAPASFSEGALVRSSDMAIIKGQGVSLLNTSGRDGVVGTPGDQKMGFQQGIPGNTHISPELYNFFQFSVSSTGGLVKIVSISFLTGHNDSDNPETHQGIIEYRDVEGMLIGSDTFDIPNTFDLQTVNIEPAAGLLLGTEDIYFSIRFNEEIYGNNSFTTQLRIDNVKINGIPPVKVRNITQGMFYIRIQDAIDQSNNGDEIEVAPGTYYEAIDFKGRAVRVYSSEGAGVTTIDAEGAYHVIKCVSGEQADTILEGFTITGGNANGTDVNNSGAGMYNDSSSPTVINCVFSSNTAAFCGGGLFNLNSSVELRFFVRFAGIFASRRQQFGRIFQLRSS
jgi:hypothetical protein